MVLAFRRGTAGGCWGGGSAAGAAVDVGVAVGAAPPPSTLVTILSTAAATLAAARAALALAEPRMGLLVLNSRHLAPKTIIIFDTAILGFLAAIRGLNKRRNEFKISHLTAMEYCMDVYMR